MKWARVILTSCGRDIDACTCVGAEVEFCHLRAFSVTWATDLEINFGCVFNFLWKLNFELGMVVIVLCIHNTTQKPIFAFLFWICKIFFPLLNFKFENLTSDTMCVYYIADTMNDSFLKFTV